MTDNSITAFDTLQATTYNVYELTNRQPFDVMKMKIMDSAPEELNSWVDILDLAMKQGVKGYGTRLKKEWFKQ